MLNIVLYQPEIPGNTANIIRTCSATGAKLHIIKPVAFDLHPRWLKRAAAGRLLSDIEHEIHATYEAFASKYGDRQIHYITRYGQQLYTAAQFAKQDEVWMMFGRESTGIPKNIMRQSLNTCLRIPMTMHERSLNLANVVTMMAYEYHRQNAFNELETYEVQKGKDFILHD